jgi:His/Glu/Gln/Arg/opine family amino acid ABC transporter permease subunit
MLEKVFGPVIDSIYRNLILGEAYKFVLEGLWTTILISALGLLLGSVVGAILCSMRLSRARLLRWSSNALVSIVRGSPVLLLLMILYYVVFADVRINPLLVAIAAFALNAGAHISEIFRSSLQGVDKKQVEAARMLGLTRIQAFLAIALPQAARIARPVFQSAAVNLIQWTSVVGYIAITDVTRSVYNIGARTGDPFFALTCGVSIYLALSYGVFLLFSKGGGQEHT